MLSERRLQAVGSGSRLLTRPGLKPCGEVAGQRPSCKDVLANWLKSRFLLATKYLYGLHVKIHFFFFFYNATDFFLGSCSFEKSFCWTVLKVVLLEPKYLKIFDFKLYFFSAIIFFLCYCLLVCVA